MKRKSKTKDQGTRKRKPQDPLVDSPIVERVRTPRWLLRRYPTLKRRIPRCIVESLNREILAWSHPERCLGLDGPTIEARRRLIDQDRERYGQRDTLEQIAITHCMNNFCYQIKYHLLGMDEARRTEKIGDRSPRVSEKLRNTTHGEFLDDIRRAIEECGLSLERALELEREGDRVTEPNLYLFPAFVRLLEMGYNIPDLSA